MLKVLSVEFSCLFMTLKVQDDEAKSKKIPDREREKLEMMAVC